jgi:hypothetical protein
VRIRARVEAVYLAFRFGDLRVLRSGSTTPAITLRDGYCVA